VESAPLASPATTLEKARMKGAAKAVVSAPLAPETTGVGMKFLNASAPDGVGVGGTSTLLAVPGSTTPQAPNGLRGEPAIDSGVGAGSFKLKALPAPDGAGATPGPSKLVLCGECSEAVVCAVVTRVPRTGLLMVPPDGASRTGGRAKFRARVCAVLGHSANRMHSHLSLEAMATRVA